MPIVDKKRLRELAGLRVTGEKVLSVYISLDPGQYPTARERQAEVHSLLDRGAKQARDDESLSHAARRQVETDIARLRRYFDDEFSAKHARGVAVFCAGAEGLFEVIKLPRPVESEVVIGDAPFIEPLTAFDGDDGYSVVLVGRRSARIFVGAPDQIREVAGRTDDVHGRHDQGGWSQARFQRGIDKEAHDHLKNTADLLFEQYKRGLVRRLVIGAHEEIYNEVRDSLHPYLRERIAGRVDVDIENASPSDVRHLVAPLIEADRRKRERRLLDQLAAEVGKDGRGCHGVEETLAALNEGRVETLLVQDAFRVGGGSCPECGLLGGGTGTCPVDGAALETTEDVVELAVETALSQSSDVLFVCYHDDLKPLGSIGAILRF